MAIAANAGVLVPTVLAWCLTLEHLAVLRDAVALALRNAVLAVQRLALGRRPSKVITTDLDVVVRELANLDVINTSSFFLFRRTEPEGGDEFANKVKSSEDKTGPEEGVCAAGERIGKLIAKLHPMVVEPTTIDNSVTIEMRNVVTA